MAQSEIDKQRSELLGVNVGTASHRLRKIILFNLVKKLNLHFCYRCNTEITLDTFSIEHKEPWWSNKSVELFWDLNNIAYSHNSCNSSYANKVTKQVDCVKGHGPRIYSEKQQGYRCRQCDLDHWHKNDEAKKRKERRYKQRAELLERIKALHSEGYSTREIANKLGNISHVAVFKKLKKAIIKEKNVSTY